MDKFIIFEDSLCYKKNGVIKFYFSLKKYDDQRKQDVVDTLNEHFNDLTVLKNPSKNFVTFLINGKPYIEQNSENTVTIHDEAKENDHHHLPVMVKDHHYVNIFDNYNVVEVWPDEYYIIKCNTSRGIFVVDKNNHLVPHYVHIFENFNIFEGKHIVVDLDTFLGAGYVKDNGIIDLDGIRKVILLKFHVSYIKKLLCKKDLKIEELKKFVEGSQCKINSTIGYNENKGAVFFVIDNFGDHYEVKVDFNEEGSKFFVSKVHH